MAAGNEAERGEKLATLAQVVRTGASAATAQESTWAELRELIRERTQTAAAEWKRLKDLRCFITAEQAVGFSQALVQAVLDTYGRDERLDQLQRHLLRVAPPECGFPRPAPAWAYEGLDGAALHRPGGQD